MKAVVALALAAGAVAAAAAVATAGAGQDRVPYPGLMTQGKVWIQNSGRSEAVPVSVELMSPDAPPLRVEVLGTSQVALASGGVLQADTRSARQAWEHQTIAIAPGQDVAAALAKPGAEGWEAVGILPGSKGSTIVLLKRPR
jgi:hypothetical protein